MPKQTISKTTRLQGKPVIPGDKSISHRGLIFGAIADGKTEVTDILESEDVQSTARCLKQMGVDIVKKGNITYVDGIGVKGFKPPTGTLDCGNSGTSMRVLMGLLAGRGVTATLTGDSSLVKRPMKRVAEPLRLMGANITLTNQDYAPLTIVGTKLHGIDYNLKIASAQIKTAIIMAGLTAEGTTRVTGEIHSRDHTERMLDYFGAEVSNKPEAFSIVGGQKLHGSKVRVPGDPSTAAFWVAAGSLVRGAHVVMENVALNPTRIGFIKVLERMGAKISTTMTSERPEPVGTIEVRSAELKGVTVTEDEVPSMIDEIPMLAVLATQAHGVTEVSGAEELRVKETDRLEAVATNLRAMGCQIDLRHDGFRIEGPQKLRGASVQSFHDHRIAMAFSIAGLVAEGPVEVNGSECVAISYPNFYETLAELTK